MTKDEPDDFRESDRYTSVMLNIALYGGGWIHNMGNSFIHIGSKIALQKALPGAQVHIIDGNPYSPPLSMGHQILTKLGTILSINALKAPSKAQTDRAVASQVKWTDLAQLDAIVISGVWLTPKHLRDHIDEFRRLQERGVPLIISGGSGTRYDAPELDEAKRMLESLKPFALITRDTVAYNAYKDICPRTYSGIDVGFFVSEALPNPLPLREKTTAYCFDRGPLPAGLEIAEHAVITHHAIHAMRYNNFSRPTFFSELAEDYLNLYAGCEETYADRVHACVAALSFGRGARLMDETPRAHLFERVGAGDIRHQVVRLDMALLEQRKQEHVALLQQVFSEVKNPRP